MPSNHEYTVLHLGPDLLDWDAAINALAVDGWRVVQVIPPPIILDPRASTSAAVPTLLFERGAVSANKPTVGFS